jgi:hypothetical protein
VQSALLAHSQRWFCWLHADTPLAVHSVLAAHSHIPLTSLHVDPKSPGFVQNSGSLEHPVMHCPFAHRPDVSPQTAMVPASPAPPSAAPNRFRVSGTWPGKKQPSTGSGGVAQRP